MGLKNLCLELARAENEETVIKILENNNFWDNPEVWQYYGSNENNFSIIGNQQSAPDAALVEKVVNSVDAVLLRECLRKGVDPEGDNAPQNLREGLSRFFNIREGILVNLSARERTKLAENIFLVATGKKTIPNYSIIDKGEGQTPRMMPETFLSLTKSNKLRIPFVQGKFNMGGTGSLQFCGNNNLQLIVSRRDPTLVELEGDDGTSNNWGFTVIRRVNPRDGMRNSAFKYLAPNGKILNFKSESLDLLPGEYPKPYSNPLKWGSFLKLYEYQLTGLKSPVYFDLYYRLSLLLPNIALPLGLVERRKGYRSESYHISLSGLSVRLNEDKSKNIELGYPSSNILNISGQEMKIRKYVFKRGKKKNYAKNEGIVFTVNGQAHGFLSKSFFERGVVGMDYLSDSILIIADCSNFDKRVREDLFMNSRDRLRNGDMKSYIERELEKILSNDKGLKELRQRRRREDVEGKIVDSKPLADVVEKVVKKSPSLSKLFASGVRISNPFQLEEAGIQEKYKGRLFPTYFELVDDFPSSNPKHCPLNQRFRVQFETDAENNYFTRDKDPGRFNLIYNKQGKTYENYSLNLWNGRANLNVQLPENVKEGDIIEFKTEVDDIDKIDPFLIEFFVVVDPPLKKANGSRGNRRKASKNKGEGDGKTKAFLDLPSIIEIERKDWEKYNFDRKSAMTVKDSGEGSYDFFINVDNVYLKTEIKGRHDIESNILKEQYKTSLVLIGLTLLREKESSSEEEQENTIYDEISKVAKAVSPILLPMINTLGDLND